MVSYAKIINFFLLFLGLAIIFVMILTIDLEQIKISLKYLNLQVIVVILTITALNILIKAVRWKYLIIKICKVKISTLFSFNSIIAGVAAGSLTPGRGTEIAKSLMLKNSYEVSLTKSIPAMLMERIIDALTIISFIFISFLFITQRKFNFTQLLIWSSVLFILGLVLLFIFPQVIARILIGIIKKVRLKPALKEKLIRLVDTFFESFFILKQKKALIIISFLSFAAFILEITQLYYLFSIFELHISIMATTFSIVAGLTLGLLTMIPGGIGTTELSQVIILKTFLPIGTKEDLLKGIILLNRIVAYYALILAGSLILIFNKKKNTKF